MPNCKLADCPIAKDGRCLEGRGNDCPNLLPDETTESGTEGRSVPVTGPAVARLYSGNPLHIKEARELAGRNRSIVVAFVGLIECGKTSLLARLHQLFQEGPLGAYQFAGSRTLLRFEEINWKSTVESGVNPPEMDRTSRIYDNSFLHFRVRASDGEQEYTEVLMNDISGETVSDAVTNQSLCDTLLGLVRADHVVVVADGDLLSDPEQCYDHCGRLTNFVQRIVQSGQIGRKTILHMVISKQDKLTVLGRPVAVGLESDFKRLFTDKVGELHCCRIAARPFDGSQPTKKEIVKLFVQWLSTSLRYPDADLSKLPAMDWARDFCRYGEDQTSQS